MKTCLTVLAAAALVAVVAGCSSSTAGSKGTGGSSTPAAAPSSASSSPVSYTPGADDDAATIASHIPGCTGAAAADVGQGGPAMTSAASCTLQGHVIVVDVWQSSGDAVLSPELTPAETVHYAHGDTWTAFVAEQGATAATSTLQLQLTNSAGGLSGQAGSDPTPTPAATQQKLTGLIAAALGGETGTS